MADIKSFKYVALLLLVFSCTGKNRSNTDGEEQRKLQMEYSRKGLEYSESAQFNTAAALHQKSLEIAENLKDTLAIVTELNHIGFNIGRIGAFDEASDRYFKVLELCELYGGKDTLAVKKSRLSALNNIGNILRWLENYEAADSILRVSLEGEREMGNTLGMAKNYANIGSIFRNRGMMDSAWVYFRLSMDYNVAAADSFGIALSHMNFGKMYEEEGDYEKALAEYGGVFYALPDDYPNQYHWLATCIATTRMNIMLGRLDGVPALLKKAMDKAEAIHSLTHLSDLAHASYLYYKKTGNYRQALDNYVLTYHFSDSIRNEENASHLQNLRLSFEHEKNARQLEHKQAEIRRQKAQRTVFAAGLAIAVVFLILLWYMLNLRNKRNRALAEMNATKDKFFSIISHDLKNPAVAQRDALLMLQKNLGKWDTKTLSVFYSELLKSADSQVELLYNLLGWAQLQTGRMTYAPEPFDIVPKLRSEAVLITKMADQKGVALKTDLPEEAVVTGDKNMLATVVRNLLTNAVKFTPAGGEVVLSASIGTQATTITIADNGVGMTAEQVRNLFRIDSNQSQRGTAGESGTGLGLVVCNELLEKHGSALQVESEAGKGSRFWFVIK